MKRAKHNLSHYRILAGDMGFLYPYSMSEVLPGDTFRMQSSALVRIQPLMTPLMHPVQVTMAHFFVPARLLWSDWEDYITGKRDLNLPYIATAVAKNSIQDYMGSPVGQVNTNALPVRAYNMIWNEFFRDQQLSIERSEDLTSIARVAWTKDYFTTARPYAQSGGELGESASITFAQDVPITAENTLKGSGYNAPAQTPAPGGTAGKFVFQNVKIAAGTVAGELDINEWRKAMALQRFREARNKFGSRYKDLLAYLGVRSPDSRLDRPEYLGGNRQTIAFSEVLNTSENSVDGIPLGAYAGHGIASVRTRPARAMFLEHGYTISLIFIRPKLMYINASDRTWLRRKRDDFWQKEDEVLGEQPVSMNEIFAGAGVNQIFGYSPRHDDYRTQRSYAVGPMREDAYNTWHMARKFQSAPALNEEFVTCQPTKRVFRSSTDPEFYAMAQNRISARRLVSKYARH